jgi:hypothetical protein
MGRKQPIAEDIVAVTNGPYQSRRQRVAASRFDDDRTAVGNSQPSIGRRATLRRPFQILPHSGEVRFNNYDRVADGTYT